MSDVPEGWVTYPAEELVAALRRLGFTIYPPGSAVPALVEAAREWASAEAAADKAWNEGGYPVTPFLSRRDTERAMLETAARKVAGEGER